MSPSTAILVNVVLDAAVLGALALRLPRAVPPWRERRVTRSRRRSTHISRRRAAHRGGAAAAAMNRSAR